MFLIIFFNILSLFVSNNITIVIVLLTEWLQIFMIKGNMKLAYYLPVQGNLREVRIGSDLTGVIQAGCVVVLWSFYILMIGILLFERKRDIL